MNGAGLRGSTRGAGGSGTVRIPIGEEADVAVARARALALALAAGFRTARAVAVATAVSEVARNIVVHAGRGEVRITPVEEGGRRGLEIVARDDAPGIADVEGAMADGYSTARGLGLGLPGARRLMDEFTLASTVGEGTTVTMRKWVDDGR